MKVTPGYIYVLKEKGAEFGPYKIGETADLEARLKSVFGQALKTAEYCQTWFVPVQGRVDEIIHLQLENAYPNSRIHDQQSGRPTEWFNLPLEKIVSTVSNVVQGLQNRYAFEHKPNLHSEAQPDLILEPGLQAQSSLEIFFSKTWKVGKANYSLKQILAQTLSPTNTAFSRWAKRHGIQLLQAAGQKAYFRFSPQPGSQLAEFAKDNLFSDLPETWIFSTPGQ